jgi:chromosome segregation ATPase
MSTELSKVRARVSAQERQALATAARIEEVAQDVESIAGQVAGVKASVETLSQNVDRRFEHVYGELADIKANTIEIRNLLASLVARLEKGDGKE